MTKILTDFQICIFKSHNKNVCLVYISYSDQYNVYTDYFSIYANLCAPKSRKSTCPGFDLVTPLHLNLTPNLITN